jgi:MFS family permease
LRFTGLWLHPDFRKLWAGETISVFGSQITLLALPLVAVLALDANAGQMGLLTAAGFAPDLLVSLLAGAWVDRVRRRPVLIGADLGRAALLATIPLAWELGRLTMIQLYLVAFATGVLSVFFRLAYVSLLPSLVGPAQLVEGNSKLEVSRSVAKIGGPGLAGGLVQIFGAPLTLIADGVSFICSAFFIRVIRTPEPVPAPPDTPQTIWREIEEGLRFTFGNPILRALTLSAATFNVFGALIGALFVLYATDDLGIGPGLLGLILAIGAPGGLLGAILAARLTERYGLDRTMILALSLSATSTLLIPLAGGPHLIATAILAIYEAWFGFGASIFGINIASLSQVVTPNRLLGRMRASTGFLYLGGLPLGALAGGALGAMIGLRPAIGIGAVGALLSVPWLIFSPLPGLREHPAPAAGAVVSPRHHEE